MRHVFGEMCPMYGINSDITKLKQN
jgi:hypothetical protein